MSLSAYILRNKQKLYSQRLFESRNNGFTLAEVLITLVIIGIIAAITVPTIIANSQEAERSAKVKKVYSTIANAMTRARADGATFDFEFKYENNTNEVKTWFNEYLKPYLNTTKICYDTPGCWNEGYTKLLNGKRAASSTSREGYGIGIGIVTMILNDGTFLELNAGKGNTDDGVFERGEHGLLVYFDINGGRNPNVVGKDTFLVVFTDENMELPYKGRDKAFIDKQCTNKGTGYSCIYKYITK